MASYTAYVRLIRLAHVQKAREKSSETVSATAGFSGGNNVAVDNQFSTDIKVCDPRIRGGGAVCHTDGKCSVCVYADKFEHIDKYI